MTARPCRRRRRILSGTQFRFEEGAYAVLSFSTEAGRVPDALTPAEREVLRALLSCRSNLQIARERGTSIRTVANQVQALFRKLGVGSRAELAAWAGRTKIRR